MVEFKFDFTSPSGNSYSIRLSSYDDSYFPMMFTSRFQA